jgi:hypothetical protein
MALTKGDNLGRVTGYVQAHKPSSDPEKPYYLGGFIISDVTNSIAFTNFNVGGAITQVMASNTNGVTAGYYSTNGWSCGFINKAGVTESFRVELPQVVSTEIWDMNDRGWLVGSYAQLNENNQPVKHGFLAVPTPPQPIPLEMQRVQGAGPAWQARRLCLSFSGTQGTWLGPPESERSAPCPPDNRSHD